MQTKKLIMVVVFGLVCFGSLPSGRSQIKPVKVALASKEVLDNAPFFIGMKKGFFEQDGISVEPSYFRGGGDVIRALTTRSVDLGGNVAASALFIAAARGEDLKIVSGGGGGLVGVVWIVRTNSPIRSLADLKGKKVGISRPGSLTHTAFQAILRTAGLEHDVQIVPVGGPGDSWTAVRNGIVDASWHVAPSVYALVVKKEARILLDSSNYLKHYQQSVIAASGEVIGKSPDIIRSLLKGRAKAVEFLWQNPAESVSIWAKELGLEPSIIELAYKSIPRDHFETGAPTKENLMAALQEAVETGSMKRTLSLDEVLDMRFLPQ